MPSIKDFEEKNPRKNGKADDETVAKAKPNGKSRRRPGREMSEDKTEDLIMEMHTQDHSTVSPHPEANPHQDSYEAAVEQNPEADRRRVKLDFYGSELLRARAPKAFELAETVAEEWVNNGRFEGLPVGHPLAQYAAQVGLRKAKEIEKKLDEKGVFMMARMGLEYAKTKLHRKA